MRIVLNQTPDRSRYGPALRWVLVSCALCVASNVGGCAGTGGDGDPTPSPTASPSPSPSPDPSPTPSPQPAIAEIPPAERPRVAIQSGCAQNVLACTGTRPIPDIDIDPGPDQFLTIGEGSVVVTGSSETGIELVRLMGSGSVPGMGAEMLTYSWSYGATDTDRDSLSPGVEFSRAPDVLVGMATGFHYVRLIVRNGDEPAMENWSPGDNQTNFLELEIEIRISDSPFLARTGE